MLQLQLIRQILKDPEDTTVMALLFANQTESDILLREELEEAASKNPDRLRLWYTVDRPLDGKFTKFDLKKNSNNTANWLNSFLFVIGWKYSSGFVSAEMMAEHLYPPADDTFVIMCGPPPMVT